MSNIMGGTFSVQKMKGEYFLKEFR